ncbi:MAG: sulfite exporter TauE/SafE family protein [Aigarchaeota archaeon]|nr:sulfite exporter TauE/SafE family protein [Aigarchaeota archaeon]MDW8092480.1 sulfite exporter TauE/SafE family protein [Nitrososphaerota archaeon]
MIEQFLYFLLGLAASVYGTIVGAGGGFIASPTLLVLGNPPSSASHHSLFLVLASAAMGSISYSLRKVGSLRVSALYTSPGFVGGLLGPFTHLYINEVTYKISFATLLICVAIYLVLRREKRKGEVGSTLQGLRYRYLIPLLSFIMGAVGSLFGIGGGTLMSPALILMGIDVHLAVSVSLTLATFTGLSGLLSYSLFSHVDLLIVIPLIVGGLIGGRIAPRIAIRMGRRWVVRLLSLALLILALSLIEESLQA